NIFYTGATANQEVIPALRWFIAEKNARRFFFVGSDYLWPHALYEIIEDTAKELGATIVGKRYAPIDSVELGDIVKQIEATKPDMILEAIAGFSKVTFCKALRQRGITSEKIPVLSFSTVGRE